jgi:hypothetical protein
MAPAETHYKPQQQKLKKTQSKKKNSFDTVFTKKAKVKISTKQ